MNEAHVSRRGFLSGTAASAVGAGLALVLPSEMLSQSALQAAAKPPRLNLDMVQEFVRVGHFDLDRTKTLLAQEPGCSTPRGTGAEETGKPRSAAPVTWAAKTLPCS